jgi:hypothetical protein
MSEAVYYSAIATREKIDGGAGIIYGVSVITEGEAQGQNEGTWIDRTTLSQIRSISSQYSDGVKVKLSESKEHDGSAGQIVGALRNFHIDGNQLRADLHLLKASKKYDLILEMAQTMASQFGLSVVIPKELEKVDGKQYLRCSEIYSVDIVEAPAANKNGLFSKSPEKSMESKIKYAKGDSGEHDKDCECKGCMSKHSKKEMSAFMASMLGLPETATEAEIQTTFKAARTGDLDEFTRQLTETKAELSALKSGSANALALSKKAEIDNLITEATRLGKVVPLDNDDLYTVKDGICTIKMEPTQLSKIVSKLVPGKIKMSKQAETPKTIDGKEITNRRGVEFKSFLASKREEGANELNALFSQMNTQTGLSRTN